MKHGKQQKFTRKVMKFKKPNNEELDPSLLKNANLPPKYWGTINQTYVPKKVIEQARKIILSLSESIESGRSFCIRGKQDVGKTSVMCHILVNALMYNRKAIRYTLEELTEINYSSDKSLVSFLKNYDVIGLDNVDGMTRPNQGRVDTLEQTMRFCKEWNICTLLATDLEPEQFEAQYGSRSMLMLARYYQEIAVNPNPMTMKDYFDHAYQSAL